MSLDVEGNGATCVECGVFDFLPTLCPHCKGVFCRQHAYQHHIHVFPSAAEPRRDTSSPPDLVRTDELCVPPHMQDRQQQQANTPAEQSPPAKTANDVQCYLCPSTWCVLRPCERCGHCFCAAHRFHGHEEDDEAADDTPSSDRVGANNERVRNKRFTPRVVPPSLRRRTADVPANALTAACAPYVRGAPLSLAPPQYRSRMMDLVAVLCRVATLDKGDLSSNPCGMWEVAVCSLSVAVEVTVGQLMQRCFWSLGLAGPAAHSMDANALQVLCADSTPYRMEARTSHDGSRQSVGLHLSEVPLSCITKEALLPGEAVCFRVGADARGVDGAPRQAAPLQAFLSHLLLPESGKLDAEGSQYDYVVKDDRVRALVTRLHLHAKPAEDMSPPPPPAVDATVVDAAGAEASLQPPATSDASPNPAKCREETTSRATDTAGETGVAGTPAEAVTPWPFHAPPPLSQMRFHNNKANPLGARQVAASSSGGAGGGGRVLVAVFTEDASVTSATSIPPFVLALGKDWPLGKLVERVKDEAFGLLSSPADRQAACAPSLKTPFPTFEVYVLGSAASASTGGAKGGVERLATCGGTPLVRDGDVLFLGSARACAPGSPLVAEVARMKDATGKELMAQRMEMMKKCSVM